jgi:hypothetical protein
MTYDGIAAVNLRYCPGTCWGELQESRGRFANWVGTVYKSAVVRIQASFSVIYFTANNDKKNCELCRVVKLLRIKWLRHVSGMEEMRNTYSIVNKI